MIIIENVLTNYKLNLFEKFLGNITKQKIDNTIDIHHSENIDPNTTINILSTPTKLNGTFKKKTKLNSTFDKVPDRGAEVILDQTVTLNDNIDEANDKNERNTTKTLAYSDATFSRKKERNRTYDTSQFANLQRNSHGYPSGSSDSLDRLSNISGSSRGSTKVLNMADVDAIIEQQEKCKSASTYIYN